MNTETQSKKSIEMSPRSRGVGHYAQIALAVMGLSFGGSWTYNHLFVPNQSSEIASLEGVTSTEYNRAAVSNFCNELIENRAFEINRGNRFNIHTRPSEIDANRAYVTQLTEIIASLKGDNYSAEAYAVARAEFHNAVKEYAK
jgi:hypothetical protein